MSGPTVCNECELPRARIGSHRHICRCNETAGDLRVLVFETENEADAAEAEAARLRAVLASIAALQTEEPTHGDGLHGLGLWQAAEMARAGLGGGK